MTNAVLIAILTFVLPADEMMFTVGNANLPIVPAIVFGIVGIVLLATAGSSGKEAAPNIKPAVTPDPEKVALNKQFETIGWGCFLVMLGGFMFIPDTVVSKGFWSIGIGLIMLELNLARYMNKIRMSGFTTFLGILSLITGVIQLIGLVTDEGAILLIILGAYLIAKPWFDKRQLFGKAEES